eukprot:jgi/Bigna1/138765/aug1.46_g13473
MRFSLLEACFGKLEWLGAKACQQSVILDILLFGLLGLRRRLFERGFGVQLGRYWQLMKMQSLAREHANRERRKWLEKVTQIEVTIAYFKRQLRYYERWKQRSAPNLSKGVSLVLDECGIDLDLKNKIKRYKSAPDVAGRGGEMRGGGNEDIRGDPFQQQHSHHHNQRHHYNHGKMMQKPHQQQQEQQQQQQQQLTEISLVATCIVSGGRFEKKKRKSLLKQGNSAGGKDQQIRRSISGEGVRFRQNATGGGGGGAGC